jgi:predicted XRE-type DNA-binding protein
VGQIGPPRRAAVRFLSLPNANLHCMTFTQDLRLQLARHVCAIVHGWPQAEAAVIVRLSQPDICRLRAGAAHRFTADRLLRAIAHSGHHISISIHAMQKRFKETPSITVLRYDRYGRLLELPPWQARTPRRAGEGAP